MDVGVIVCFGVYDMHWRRCVRHTTLAYRHNIHVILSCVCIGDDKA
jgi:hypothetical protein